MKYCLGMILIFQIIIVHASDSYRGNGTKEELKPLIGLTQRDADFREQDTAGKGLIWSKSDWAQATENLNLSLPIRRFTLRSLWKKIRRTKKRVAALEDTVTQQKDASEFLANRVTELELQVDELASKAKLEKIQANWWLVDNDM